MTLWPRKYEVLVGNVAGHKEGDTFELTGVSGFSERAWVEGGHVRRIGGQKAKCPACQETGKAADKKREFTAKQLEEHYKESHPGLVVPAGEEE